MATNNINKIVRGNLKFKPWILSKTPTDIVNGYVQRLYKQIPDNLKPGLIQPHFANNSPENRVPVRAIRITAERFPIPIVNTVKTKARTHDPQHPQRMASKSFLNGATKIGKSPNLKIYNTRRYGSSASSSSASILRTTYEERRKKVYKPANSMGIRTFKTSSKNSNPPEQYENKIFNEMKSQVTSRAITSAICNELMPIDNKLKAKIRAIKPPVSPMEALEMKKPHILEGTFKGWSHTSKPQLSKLTAPLVFPRGNTPQVAQVKRLLPTLMPINRKQYGYKWSQTNRSPMRENVHYQVSSPSSYAPTKKQPKVEPKKVENPLEFVCRTRSRTRPRVNTPKPKEKPSNATWQMFRNFTEQGSMNKKYMIDK